MKSLGVSLFFKNIKKNICAIILLAFILVIFSSLASMYFYEKSKLDVVMKLEENDGYFFEISNVEDMIFKGTLGALKGVSDALMVKSVNSEYRYLSDGKSGYEKATVLGYDSRIYDWFEPLVVEGEWLAEADAAGDSIPVVITKELSGLKVGDEFSLSYIDVNFKVCGIIDDGAEILWNGNNYGILNEDYSCLYYAAYYEESNEFYVIARNEDLEGKLQLNDSTKAFVYFEGALQQELTENLDYMSKNGHYISLEEFNRKSSARFDEMIASFAPTVVIIAVIVLLTIITISMIEYSSNMKYLSIYYLVGMSQAAFLRISFINKGLVSLFGAALAGVVHFLLWAKLGNTVYMNFDTKELLLCAIIVLVMFAAQLVSDAIMFFKSSPAESVRSRGMM